MYKTIPKCFRGPRLRHWLGTSKDYKREDVKHTFFTMWWSSQYIQQGLSLSAQL